MTALPPVRGRGEILRDAAAALFVSVRTVEAHAAAIYRKLGVRTRAELAHLLADTPPRRHDAG